MVTKQFKGSPEDADLSRADSLAREIFSDVANKWALLIIETLGDRTRRFSELRNEIEGISHKMLTQNLRMLERNGLVGRTVHPTVPPRVEYTLTEAGQACARRSTGCATGPTSTSVTSRPPAPASTADGRQHPLRRAPSPRRTGRPRPWSAGAGRRGSASRLHAGSRVPVRNPRMYPATVSRWLSSRKCPPPGTRWIAGPAASRWVRRRLAVELVLAWADVKERMPGRLRPCGNPECRLFLLDRSRATTARWCSMKTCGNRLKARRHQVRTRETPRTE
jgi:DNA-binding HxlR family transcriptional regulator